MPRMLGIACLLTLVVFSSTARAATIDPARVAAVEKAAAAFLALAKDSYKTGQPPRQTDPAVKPLLDTVFNTAGINDNGALPLGDFDKLQSWTLQMVKVGSVYLLAGTGIQDPTQIGSIDQQQQAQIAKNTAAFAPEIGRYFDAQIDLERALIDAVDAEMKAHPDEFQSAQKQGAVAKIKGGVKQSIAGALSTFQTAGISASWMNDRLRTLAPIAPSLATSLADQDRRDLAELARQTAAKIDDREVKSGLESFAKTVQGAPTAAPPAPSAGASAQGLTGADRKAYVEEYVTGCIASMQKENPDVSATVAKTFCGCLAEKGADATTAAEYVEIRAHGPTPEQRQRMVPFAVVCRKLAVQGEPPGGQSPKH